MINLRRNLNNAIDAIQHEDYGDGPSSINEALDDLPDDITDFQKGVRAFYDYLARRAANHFHGNPLVNKICDQENELIMSWANDGLKEVDIESYNEWKKICEL